MSERDNEVRVKHDPPRGILNLRSGETLDGLSRYWPSDDLAPFVEHYWIVRWNLGEPRMAETLPHPSIHMVLESSGTSEIVGLMRTRFTRMLEGRGWVLGTRFKPGGFRPFVKSPVSAFTDRRVPVEEVWGARAEGLGSRVMDCANDRDGIAMIESFLRGFPLAVSKNMTLAMQLAARIEEERAITRVDQLAGELGTSVRTLQRLFSEFVGASPKWVIQRHRLLEAAARVAEGEIVDWSGLALDLGYADQAHFIRDFKRLVGRSPAGYARELEGAGRTGGAPE